MSDQVILAPILLLVEDDKNLRDLLEIALSEEGFEVVVATDGTAGMAALEADGVRFKGLITDIRLGAGPSGWEVGKRAEKSFRAFPLST